MNFGTSLRLIAIASLTLFSIHPAQAQSKNTVDPYFQIKEIKTTVISQTDQDISVSDEDDYHSLNTPLMPKAYEGIDPMAIADIAFKVWEIVKDGKPVVTLNTPSASALPVLANGDWRQLTGWKRERNVTFKVSVKNAFGGETVAFKYAVKMIYGGGVRGKGLYIASARIQPLQVKALWGYNFDVQVSVPAIVNQGSEEDPLAAIYMDMNYQISTMVKSDNYGESYLLQGDGALFDTKSGEQFFDGDARLNQ